MKPKRIILIRHGESEGNVNKKIYAIKPDYALMLSENGVKQAKDLGDNLNKLLQKFKEKIYLSFTITNRHPNVKLAENFENWKVN